MQFAVVATTNEGYMKKYPLQSLPEARNTRDFLEETGEYRGIAIYQLQGQTGPLKEWVELEEISA
ncbi:MAG: hypothetical protein OK422_01645 [Thaumarchaeota archaeon]|nr:hypothetical protein [Nitrososphaerota archaeon]